MTAKHAVWRRVAESDAESAIDHYLTEGGDSIARAFLTALQASQDMITQNPGAGSPRFAHELDLPGLRSWPVGKFPYRVFYVERADYIDIWRVLDARRDIPAWLSDLPEQ